MKNIFRKISQFFSCKAQSVKQASTLLAITALLSNILGLGRNLIFYRFIRPDQLDIYFASFRLADFLFNLLIFGAITSAFIPIISEMVAKNQEEEARKTTNQLISVATVFFVVLILILNIFLNQIIHLIVPGFDASRLATTVFLSRLMLLQTIFFSWSFILGSLLNAHHRFTSYALAPLTYNLAIIIGGLLSPHFGLIAVSLSVIVGAFLHFLIQYREAKQLGYAFKIDLKFSPKIKEIIKLMIPRSLAQGMSQIVLIVYTSLASTLQAGSIAIFSGMNDLQTAPTVVVGNSLATAFFPSLSSLVAEENYQEMNKLISKVVRVALFVLIPTIVITLSLRAQIVRLYFGIGGASWQLTDIAITTLVFFMIGIIPAVLVAMLARIFYAFKDTKTPMRIQVGTSIIGIIVAVIGIRLLHFNVATLALAESVIAISQVVAYLFALERHQHLNPDMSRIWKTVWLSSLGSLLLLIVTKTSLYLIDLIYQSSGLLTTHKTIPLLLQTVIAIILGSLVYFIYSELIELEELKWLMKRKFFQKRP